MQSSLELDFFRGSTHILTSHALVVLSMGCQLQLWFSHIPSTMGEDLWWPEVTLKNEHWTIVSIAGYHHWKQSYSSFCLVGEEAIKKYRPTLAHVLRGQSRGFSTDITQLHQI